MALKFYNTLTRKKQAFEPIKQGFTGMYTCGPTVHDFAHIGNFRAYIFEDVLRRYLEYKGLKVKQIMNITDVEDKIIKKIHEKGTGLKEYTDKYTKAFFEDIKRLNIQPAFEYPRATEYIKQMVEITKGLLKKKYAYKTEDGCIYYKISKFKKYGQLANVNVKNLEAGASGRVLADEYDKEAVQDFALWKAWTPEDGKVFWETELGKGRPGWHIECSAMSTAYLGETFDIHCGGVDNIFPHHQNEIAQTEGFTGKKFVNYWLHCEHLLVNGKKMSKSLGNFYTLRDLLEKGYDPISIRYLLLSVHYRQKLNFTLEALQGAKNSLERLWDFMRKLREAKETEDNAGHNKCTNIVMSGESSEGLNISRNLDPSLDNPKITKEIERARKKFEKNMDNDLEMSSALATIFDLIKKVNKMTEKKSLSPKDAEKTEQFMLQIDKVLGILHAVFEEKIPADVKKLADEREKARLEKDWKKADALREEIKKKGYFIEDIKEGVRIKKI